MQVCFISLIWDWFPFVYGTRALLNFDPDVPQVVVHKYGSTTPVVDTANAGLPFEENWLPLLTFLKYQGANQADFTILHKSLMFVSLIWWHEGSDSILRIKGTVSNHLVGDAEISE